MTPPEKEKRKRRPSAKSAERKRQICLYITDFTETHGYPPSVREISAAVGLQSPSTAQKYITMLKEEGILRKTDGKTRTLSTVSSGSGVPILGKVTAGQPILAFEDSQGRLAYRTEAPSRDFALRVKGDSMMGAGILDGDFVVVRPQETAENGEIVVALLDDEATVKRLQRKNGEVWLLPENPHYEPINAEHCVIAGRVVAVVREYR